MTAWADVTQPRAPARDGNSGTPWEDRTPEAPWKRTRRSPGALSTGTSREAQRVRTSPLLEAGAAHRPISETA